MTKYIKINNSFSYSLLILVLVAASFITLPTLGALASVQPTISIDSPTAGALINQTSVSLSGTFTDQNVTQVSDLIFSAIDQVDGTDLGIISDSVSKPADWTFSGPMTNGSWAFNGNINIEGNHVITIKITEKADSTVTNQSSISFTINTNRPYVSGVGMVLPDNTVQAGEDVTSIPPNAKIRMTVADDEPMTGLVSKINDTTNPYNPIKVMLSSAINTNPTPITGTTAINDLGLQSGKYVYDITFTPSQPLTLNQTYIAFLDANLVDDSNQTVFAKFFKFTTKANGKWDDAGDPSKHDSPNPHGHYQLNTNMCAACHSTHVNNPYNKYDDPNSKIDPNTDGGSYLVAFNDKLNSNPQENYCMACHDGTTNAPVIDGMDNNYHHDNPIDYTSSGTNNLKEANSCTTCHNPHLEWSAQNPNLLKDHYIYTHNSQDQGQMGLSNLTVDSLDTSCETCHEQDCIIDNSTNTAKSIYQYSSSEYQVLSYKKSLTAEGAITAKATDPNQNTVLDYALCLRCHSANPNLSKSNIEQYYTDTTSGHDFASYLDKGSKLNGPLPCAECHSSHGSSNIKLLRSQLGNVLTNEKFTSNGTTWDAVNERSFCLKCHNNQTEIYGKVGLFITNDNSGNPITGHQSGDTQACSSCHGSGSTDSDKFLSAAHDPKVSP